MSSQASILVRKAEMDGGGMAWRTPSENNHDDENDDNDNVDDVDGDDDDVS